MATQGMDLPWFSGADVDTYRVLQQVHDSRGG
jgi:hypothetical protein